MESLLFEKVSKKAFTERSKKFKRKNHVTASEARDAVARSLGYSDYETIKIKQRWK